MAVVSSPVRGTMFTVPSGYVAIVRQFRLSTNVGLIYDASGFPVDPQINFYIDNVGSPSFCFLGDAYAQQNDWIDCFFTVPERSVLTASVFYGDTFYIPLHNDFIDIRGNLLPSNGQPSNFVSTNVKPRQAPAWVPPRALVNQHEAGAATPTMKTQQSPQAIVIQQQPQPKPKKQRQQYKIRLRKN